MAKVLRDLECGNCGNRREEMAERDGGNIVIKGPGGQDVVNPVCEGCETPLQIVEVNRIRIGRAVGDNPWEVASTQGDLHLNLLTNRDGSSGIAVTTGDTLSLKVGEVLAVGDMEGGAPRAAKVVEKREADERGPAGTGFKFLNPNDAN